MDEGFITAGPLPTIFHLISIVYLNLHFILNNYLKSSSRLGNVLLLPAVVVFFWASKGL